MNSCIKKLTVLTLINSTVIYIRESTIDVKTINIITDISELVKNYGRSLILEYTNYDHYNNRAINIATKFNENEMLYIDKDIVTAIIYLQFLINDLGERVSTTTYIKYIYDKVLQLNDLYDTDIYTEKMDNISNIMNILYRIYLDEN